MRTKIKICGLKTLEDIQMINRLKPDYAGFVFADGKRKISPSQAETLKKALSPDIKAVGVFVNEDPQAAAGLAAAGIIDLIQLHGDEDEAYLREIRKLTDVPVMKAVRVRDTEDILRAEALSCDFLLLDTYTKGVYGGSGKTFDWSRIPRMKKPFFLAGGLNAANVKDAIARCAPMAVDVSSAVETEGRKDEEKIKAFLKAVRGEAI